MSSKSREAVQDFSQDVITNTTTNLRDIGVTGTSAVNLVSALERGNVEKNRSVDSLFSKGLDSYENLTTRGLEFIDSNLERIAVLNDNIQENNAFLLKQTQDGLKATQENLNEQQTNLLRVSNSEFSREQERQQLLDKITENLPIILAAFGLLFALKNLSRA